MAKRPLLFEECARCGECDTNSLHNVVILIDDYSTQLCLSCRNVFGAWMRDQPAFIRHQHLHDAISMAGAMSSADGRDRLDLIGELRTQLRGVEAELHELSRAFVEDYKDA